MDKFAVARRADNSGLLPSRARCPQAEDPPEKIIKSLGNRLRDLLGFNRGFASAGGRTVPRPYWLEGPLRLSVSGYLILALSFFAAALRTTCQNKDLIPVT